MDPWALCILILLWTVAIAMVAHAWYQAPKNRVKHRLYAMPRAKCERLSPHYGFLWHKLGAIYGNSNETMDSGSWDHVLGRGNRALYRRIKDLPDREFVRAIEHLMADDFVDNAVQWLCDSTPMDSEEETYVKRHSDTPVHKAQLVKKVQDLADVTPSFSAYPPFNISREAADSIIEKLAQQDKAASAA